MYAAGSYEFFIGTSNPPRGNIQNQNLLPGTAIQPPAPPILPDAPTNLVATAGDGRVSLEFDAPANTGGAAITGYEYQLGDGNWVSADTTSSPITISGLNNGESYSIALRAVTTAGPGTATDPISVVPIMISAAPSNLVATAGDGSVTLEFDVPANTGGSAITDYEYQLGDGNWVSAGTNSSPITISGLNNGVSYTIALRAVTTAGPGTASAAISVDMPSPASAFDEFRSEIRQVIVDEAERALRSSLSVNQRMTRSARERFIAGQSPTVHCSELIADNPDITLAELEGCDDGDGVASRNDVPFDVTGSADFTNGVLSTQGSFFEQRGNVAGTKRRLFFGDFDIHHDSNTGSRTATLSGRVARENTVSDRTMLGYFLGGEFAQSDIRSTTFAGDNQRYGLTIGGYAVHQLRDNLYADGFATFGVGRNNLDMANDVLELESSYTTQTPTIGGSLSGIMEYEYFELRPELAFSYGKTWIGTVGFTGRAYGLVDDNLSLDAGSVRLGQIMFRPEFRIPLNEGQQASGSSVLTFAPRLICETSHGVVSRTDCGGGAEFGIKASSEDGRSNVNAGASMDRVGKSTRTSIQLNMEYHF